jgi:hypothetical protein
MSGGTEPMLCVLINPLGDGSTGATRSPHSAIMCKSSGEGKPEGRNSGI